MRLIAIGDNVVDIYKERNEMFPGGNALNVAVLAKHSGAKQTAFIGIIGNDDVGDHIIDSLEKNEVDISRIRRACGESGKAYVDLNEDGDRIFVGSNKGGIQSLLKIRLTDEDYQLIKQYDVLHTSIYSSLENDLETLKKSIQLSFDFSNHFDHEILKQVCPHLTFAFLSGSHLTEIEIKELFQEIHSLGTPYAVVTRGSSGVMMSYKGEIYEQGIVKANVIDTLGAGDSFIAGFLTRYLENHNIQDALQFAAYRASLTCEVNGAFGFGKKLDSKLLSK
ncbi:hypothetical protein AN964_04415 [Heyndrickxia shackletonii]|uniref:Carbohydrate kinase PfkB domain-containing protein n=1 Tax=Heyndrickxia shackletonii TaxID=157838 RepID=A0A0Q3WPW7_9BACI|nr:PfkB family carbohydrate kinase [Heyndrickxia shackletonii]KQL52835.1 hypothetical protein AN964_04415 [Heyndrickxia shackletonii]NEZ00402.1 fructoselysine 6-kinase [Heyndrickxia shackletonii]